MKRIAFVVFLSVWCGASFADAPVVEYSTDVGSDSGAAKTFALAPEEKVSHARSFISGAGLSIEQRINKLEQQISHINSQSLGAGVEELQQRLQKLTGQIEEQSHRINQLETQLKDFYQDLNSRVKTGTASSSVLPKQQTPESNAVPSQNLDTKASAASIDTAGDEAVAVAPAPSTSQANKKPADVGGDFLKEQQVYQSAIDMLPDKKYASSESKLREYLKMYPKGVYVSNAHYWLGEINFLQKNFDAAEEEFKIVVDKYPKAKRVADAMLKLALVHQNQGREPQARTELKKLIKLYPGTSAAQLAKQQLGGV